MVHWRRQKDKVAKNEEIAAFCSDYTRQAAARRACFLPTQQDDQPKVKGYEGHLQEAEARLRWAYPDCRD